MTQRSWQLLMFLFLFVKQFIVMKNTKDLSLINSWTFSKLSTISRNTYLLLCFFAITERITSGLFCSKIYLGINFLQPLKYLC